MSAMRAWKVAQLVGVLLLLLGVVIRVGGEFYGMWLVVTGIIVFVLGRVGAWLKSDAP
jgi:hypothetical protein